MSEHLECKEVAFPIGAFFKCPSCELTIEYDVEQEPDGTYAPVLGGYTQCEKCEAFVHLPKFQLRVLPA